MKLNAVHRQAFVHEPHHQTIGGFRVDRKRAWHAGALDNQRMIARRLQRSVDTAKHPSALMADLGHLAMQGSCPHHFAAKSLTDRLMAEAHAEDRHRRRGPCYEVEANDSFVWSSGARGTEQGGRPPCH